MPDVPHHQPVAVLLAEAHCSRRCHADIIQGEISAETIAGGKGNRCRRASRRFREREKGVWHSGAEQRGAAENARPIPGGIEILRAQAGKLNDDNQKLNVYWVPAVVANVWESVSNVVDSAA